MSSYRSRHPADPATPAPRPARARTVVAAALGGALVLGAGPPPSLFLSDDLGAASGAAAAAVVRDLAGDAAGDVEAGGDVIADPSAFGAPDEFEIVAQVSDLPVLPLDVTEVLARTPEVEPWELPEFEVPEADEPQVFGAADGERIDAERMRVWLADRDSPMAEYAEELVAAGLEHDVDPRLVVGIAAIESSAGKRLPPGSHNAWGWNGDGPHGLKAWPSWPEAIHDYTEGLARVYDTDNVDERMARKYVPPNWEKWLRTVRWVIDDI